MLHKIKRYGKGIGILLAIGICGTKANAQTPVSSTITGTYTSGSYYNNTSITIDPVTDINPGAGQSVEFYIGGCAPLTTSLAVLGTDKNYIVSSVPKIPGYVPGQNNGTGPGNVYTNCDVMQAIQYYDGLGRALQTVQQKASPQGNDIIQPVAYDAFGREVKKYLPYVVTAAPGNGAYRSAAIAEQTAFYNAPGQEAVTPILNAAYAETIFEASPLNRALEQGAPGAPWQVGAGHTIGITYGTNTAADPIKKWIVYAIGTNDGGTYPANSLYTTTTVDENLHATVEFTDKDGRIVCKKVQKDSGYTYTYYVYDDFGNLAYVIPPLPTGVSLPASFSESSSTEFNLYMYGYHYDDRNRVVQKKIPGKDWEYLVYNKMDQVVATQDGVQRGKSPKEWTFVTYDGLGRLTQTGVYQSSGSLYDIQLAVNTTADQFDTYTGAGTYGYNNAAWPNNTGVATYLTVNYYGRYDFPNKPTLYGTAPGGAMAYPAGLTGSLTKILPETGAYTGGMLWDVSYYDAKGRPVQSFSQHYKGGAGSLNTNNYDRIDNTYNDFTGELTQSLRLHFVGGTQSLQIATGFTYDHMGRKLKTTSAVAPGTNALPTPTTLSLLAYNELGQLKGKKLHGNSSDSFLQGISYTYNERGWLKSSLSPLFAMQLNYNEDNSGQYNGNISKQYWGTSGNLGKYYTYTYDVLNRLTSGIATGTSNNETVSYDDLGNIQTLVRTGDAPVNLSYINGYTGNQLNLVKNNGVAYRTYSSYDANGNALSDGQAHAISYNILNLPATVSVLNLYYVYDAGGRKLQRKMGTVPTDYIDGIQYENGVLSSVQTEEGRILNLTGTPNYEYSLKDHLGNTRVIFESSTGGTTAKQTDEYYPFGKDIVVGTVPSPKNRYLYNGKELQDGGLEQYDYGARFYDPVIARFTTVDRFAEKYSSMTPYQYAALNPIRNIDVNGDSVRVNYNGRNILYQHGRLYNDDGSDYKGDGVKLNKDGTVKGYKGFLNDAMSNLALLAQSQEGSDEISALQASSNVFVIKDAKFNPNNPNANEFVESDRLGAYAGAGQRQGVGSEYFVRVGSGGTIYFNPTSYDMGSLPEVGGGVGFRPASNLGHELAHAIDANRGLLNSSLHSSGITTYELRATYTENLIRQQLGYPYRSDYNGKSVLDINGKPMTTDVPRPYIQNVKRP